MTPRPLPMAKWQLRKLSDRTLSETPMTTRHLAKAFTVYQRIWPGLSNIMVFVWMGGPYPSRGNPLPPPFPNQGLSPHPKIFGPPLNWHFCPPLTKNFPRALRTISLYLFNMFVNRIRFNCIGEQLCCWLIQMFIHKPSSLLPFEWTVQLTIVWFAVS